MTKGQGERAEGMANLFWMVREGFTEYMALDLCPLPLPLSHSPSPLHHGYSGILAPGSIFESLGKL